MNQDLAIVYTLPKHNTRQLKKITERLNNNYPEYEFLWSHPKHLGNSTQVPVIIQQDYELLKKIRNRMKL